MIRNVKPIETELNILNTLIGKKNLQKETIALIQKYPEIISAFPILLAIRENSIDILIDSKNFIYQNFNFKQKELSQKQIKDLSNYIIKSGFGKILKDRKIKNLVDYVTGVEVGLDSNGRKNRGGQLMESLVEEFVFDTTSELGFSYMAQATASIYKSKIKGFQEKQQLELFIAEEAKVEYLSNLVL
ncbi:MAG: hypothetical protein KAI79_16470 [Bacteroidales bacterium]|nr:hypothetical protein [Bacteroidales bacterium]